MHDALNYRVTLTDDVSYPLNNSVPNTLKTVRINISFTADDDTKPITYLDQLLDANYIYYVQSVNISFLVDGDFQVEMIVYTFYNQISQS